MDARFCPHCGSALTYDRRYYAHLGHYRCLHCGWQRPQPSVAVERWSRSEEKVWVRIRGEQYVFSWRMPGIYNLYNQAAAIASAVALDVPTATIEERLASFRPAFGRMETVMAGPTRLWLALVKNPVGFNQVLGAVADEAEGRQAVMIVINDRYADGRDVSWLWDVDFEYWVGRLKVDRWYVSGIRARDMAVRLKYAGVPKDLVVADEAVVSLLTRATREVGEGTLFVLPTYTAMLEVRQHLTQMGLVKHFREG